MYTLNNKFVCDSRQVLINFFKSGLFRRVAVIYMPMKGV